MVTINGNVEKDLNVAGINLNLNGTVGDDLRAAGGNISVNSPIGSDLLLAGGNISVAQKASVGGDLVIASGNFILDSEVKGKASISGGSITINGKINGDLKVRADQDLIFGPTSEVVGKITYTGPTPAVVREGAKIGTIEYIKLRSDAAAAKSLFAIAMLIKLIALLVAGFVLLYLFPRKIESVVSNSHLNVWKNLGIGFLVLVASPIAAILLLITVVGFYLGLIVFLMYVLTLILASIFTIFYAGNLVYSWYKKDAQPNLKRDLVLGAIALLIVSVIPFIGWLIAGIIFLITLGALVTHLHQDHKMSNSVIAMA